MRVYCFYGRATFVTWTKVSCRLQTHGISSAICKVEPWQIYQQPIWSSKPQPYQPSLLQLPSTFTSILSWSIKYCRTMLPASQCLCYCLGQDELPVAEQHIVKARPNWPAFRTSPVSSRTAIKLLSLSPLWVRLAVLIFFRFLCCPAILTIPFTFLCSTSTQGF